MPDCADLGMAEDLDHHPLMKIDVLSSQAQHLTWVSD